MSSGSVDLSAIKPISSGTVNVNDAIAKARGMAADRGIDLRGSEFDSAQISPKINL